MYAELLLTLQLLGVVDLDPKPTHQFIVERKYEWDPAYIDPDQADLPSRESVRIDGSFIGFTYHNCFFRIYITGSYWVMYFIEDHREAGICACEGRGFQDWCLQFNDSLKELRYRC